MAAGEAAGAVWLEVQRTLPVAVSRAEIRPAAGPAGAGQVVAGTAKWVAETALVPSMAPRGHAGGAPDEVARFAVEDPIETTLLADADEIALLAEDAGGEEIR